MKTTDLEIKLLVQVRVAAGEDISEIAASEVVRCYGNRVMWFGGNSANFKFSETRLSIQSFG